MSQNDGYLTFSGYADPADLTVNPVTFYGYNPKTSNDILLYSYLVPALNSLSSGAKSTANALYSLKPVFSTYTGPIVNLQRSSDNVTSDFYADKIGDFWTGPNGTGIDYVTWVNGSTAGVATWYDQSGNNNHAIQSTQSSQPRYNDLLKLVDFSTNLNNQLLVLPDGTFPTGDQSYTITLKHGKITYTGANAFYGSGTSGTNYNVLALDVYGGTGSSSYYNLYWWGDDIASTTIPINAGNIITNEYTTGAGTNSRKIYVNGTLNNQGTPNHIRSSTPYTNYIGYGFVSNYFNGQMYYLSIFSSPLSDADRAIVEAQ